LGGVRSQTDWGRIGIVGATSDIVTEPKKLLLNVDAKAAVALARKILELAESHGL
jgi:hypothetical protein